MKTNREKLPGSCSAWQQLLALAAIMIWLTACGGGGAGQNGRLPTEVPRQSCAVDPGVRHNCPLGAICVGYVTGTSVSDFTAVAFGNRPDWSPDGLQIAFHREGTVYIVNADGSGEHALVPGTEPAWSAHDGLIAFTSPEGIATVNRDGSNYKTLALNDSNNAIYLSSPSWSPDGQRIAYAQLEGTEPSSSRIYGMNADGSSPAKLTRTGDAGALERDPSLSPVDGTLAFTDVRLAVFEPVFGEVIKLSDGPASRPDWSPDGSLIAFATVNECRPNGSDIEVISPRGRNSSLLLVNALQPAWSPDGTRIAFATNAELPGNDTFPHVTEPAQIYLRETPDHIDGVSRFVFYDDQKFELQYVTALAGFFTYTGNYTQADARLTFNFHASNRAGPWTADGEIVVNRLTVKFNAVMGLADFEDGVYVLVPQEE